MGKIVKLDLAWIMKSASPRYAVTNPYIKVRRGADKVNTNGEQMTDMDDEVN